MVICGYVIECCINVEDLEIFILLLGKIMWFYFVGGLGICWDSYIYVDYIVLFYYDLMIGKLICYGENCDVVIVCLCNVLNELVIDGIKINMLLYKKILVDENF